MPLFTLIGQLFYFFLPTAVANMAPVLFRNRFQILAKPVDCGVQFRGQPLFGEHKTWRGLIVATLFGGLFFLVQQYLALKYTPAREWAPFDITALPVWFGFAFAFAAIMGDLIKSFFKRRVHIAPGHTWFPFDQIDFLVGAAVFATLYIDLTGVMWALILTIGPLLHISINRVGFWLNMKETPW